jgi:hypothetical protein
MGNVNDELTDVLLELNQYCFEKQIQFEIETKDDTVKSSIKKIKKDGEIVVQLVLGEYEDNIFLNKVSKFLMKLKSGPL